MFSDSDQMRRCVRVRVFVVKLSAKTIRSNTSRTTSDGGNGHWNLSMIFCMFSNISNLWEFLIDIMLGSILLLHVPLQF